jgi:hypothetical protein
LDNTKEINNNGIDDDNNGYVDVNGWNFVGTKVVVSYGWNFEFVKSSENGILDLKIKESDSIK